MLYTYYPSVTSTNLIYGLECNLYGLVYIGETQVRLNKRMYGHRSGINITKFPTVYQHFNQQDHSCRLCIAIPYRYNDNIKSM